MSVPIAHTPLNAFLGVCAIVGVIAFIGWPRKQVVTDQKLALACKYAHRLKGVNIGMFAAWHIRTFEGLKIVDVEAASGNWRRCRMSPDGTVVDTSE